MKYLVIFERTESAWSAHVPDLPGCVAAGDTKEEVAHLIEEAIRLHLVDLKRTAQPIPVPTSDYAIIETDVA